MKLKFTLYIITSLLLFSCGNDEKKEITPATVAKELLPTLTPGIASDKPLNKNFKNEVYFKSKAYCTKFWPTEKQNLSFLVAQNGRIIYEEYNGIANSETGQKITATTPLHIASVSKVLTATAVLMLIDANKINLDQKVNTLLEGFPYPEVTIESLLDHRSGVPNYAYFADDSKIWDKSKTLSNHGILDLLIKNRFPLEFPTNSHFAYCNTNYAMLALIIEKVTGTYYKDAMQRMIFTPLGMKDSYIYDYLDDNGKSVPSYKGDGAKIPLDFLDAIYGDKNVYSTPRDLLKFDLARNATTFLNADLRKKIYKGYSYESKGTKNYGLGIRMIEWEGGQKYYFHNGWWHGNTSSYITLKNEGATIISLSNKFTRNTYACRKLAPLFGDYPFDFPDEE